MKSLTLTAIDIGTNSISGLTANKDFKTGKIEVLAVARVNCFGVRSGEVVKPASVAQGIAKIKHLLSQKSGLKIKSALVNIGGSHLFSVNSQGLVSVSRADQKISKEDVARVLKEARAINLPPNKDILNILPKEFIIDGEGGIKEPLGLQGIRLETKALLVCMFNPVMDNLGRAFSEAQLSAINVVPSPLASARAVLNQEQKELGVVLIDIGAGTTSLAVFEKGDLVDFSVFPIGSANITNDIAIGLRTEIQTAEKIKKEFAALLSKTKKKRKEQLIEAPEKGLSFSDRFLENIVEARVSEIFGEAEKALKKISAPEQLPCGIVISGGGANLPGIVEFAKQRFKLPCRLGEIREIEAIDDLELATCAGLALLGFEPDGHNPEYADSAGSSWVEKIKRIVRIFLP